MTEPLTEPMTEPGPVPGTLLDPTRVFARRSGRIAFGVVLLAGMLALVASALAGWSSAQPPRLSAAQIIGYTWLAAAIAGWVAHAIAAARQPAPRAEALFLPS